MTKLEKLIQEFCPDGVEFRPLEQCCNILDRKRKPVTKSSREAGKYPYYGANGIQDYVSDYIFDGTFILVGEDGSVITDRGTPVVTWASGKIWVNNHAHIIEGNGTVLLRFLYHYIQTIDVSPLIHGNIPKLTGGDFRALTIPVPPLEVQREIVRILDTFTELTAELTARQKQYEYYRDMLLSFGENGGGETGNNINFFLVAEIADTNIGLATTVTKYKANQGVLLIHNSDIQENEIVLKQHEYITEAFAEKNHKKRLQENDVITVHTGDVGTSAVISKEYAGAIGFTTITSRIRNPQKVLPEYFCHYLNSHRCKAEIASMTISDRSNLNQNCFEKLRIPIPPIDEQRRIVTILDHFSTLCTDLTSALPAEIEARKKQYEYYRDNLLSFTPAD